MQRTDENILRSIMRTDELETVAEVQTPDTNTLVIGASRYDDRICWHVEARDWQAVTIEIQIELRHTSVTDQQ